MDNNELTFWDHLDILRGCIIKILIVAICFGLAAFYFKEELFAIVLAPKDYHFISYRLLHTEPFTIHLVNIGLTEQFMIHMKTAFFFGIVAASPYIIYLIYKFIAPALYQNEKRYAVRLVSSGYVMFMIGILINYFIVFPLTVRFLGTYSVSADVSNLLSLQSYIDTLLMMSIGFGIIFEIPVISWLMAMFGLLKSQWMKQYRRYAVVVILVISAIITPTSDAFTLIIVAIPILLLYEVSIIIVKATNK